MKKNILTIIIMASTIINLVLSAVLVFSVMPAMNKTSNLVDKVSSVIDLEIDSKDDESEDYTIADLERIDITYDDKVNINLQKEGDEMHYAVIGGMTVSLNKKAEDFEDVKKLLDESTVYVEEIVQEVIGEYTFSNIDKITIQQESIKRLQEKYDTKCIVELALKNFLKA